jgi:outer membrane lipoprotein SlyB
METQAGKPLHPLVWAAGIAVVLFCGVGAAAMMGWIGSGKAEPSPITQADKPQAAARAADRPHSVAKVAVAAVCHECGVVQSVNEVDIKGAGSGAGAVGGAVVGGVLGHQVGEGDNRKIGAVVGAVAGGLLGNEVEKRAKTTKSFEIGVRFDDGSNRVITEADATSWRVGDKVKVVNGVIHNNS